ncbi:MAG TPA: DUF21 domain-containing protein [candidate division WOR-3 bacterium]|uniref:DUF21 domain-containing protein n=1 Tax=candidate division WOR-3 bacterium TaxID=2052148 RepID=A0A7V0T3V4_UNCW3|nr:DUF21 domain-containing protein [candidate division WOR-3 bacterium]
MQLFAVVGLILLSGFFSGSETALYRANWVRLTHWANRGRSGAGLALRLLDRREATMIAVLVGNNLVNVFASVIVAEFVARTFGPAFTAVGVVLLVALTLVLGEYMPKALAQSNPNRWLRRVAGPLVGATVLFAPASALLAAVARLFQPRRAGAPAGARSGPTALSAFSSARASLNLTRQDLLAALRQRERELARPAVDAGVPPALSGPPISSLASRLLRFSGLTLAEAAIPLARVKTVPGGATREALLAFIERYGFSRIPVHRDGVDDITGVIFAKDLLAPGAPEVRAIRRISARARLMEVLDEMQRRGEHIAVVEDEGRVRGIVTLEDILEELVGEIRSED